MTEDMDQEVLVRGTGSETSKSDSYFTMNIAGSWISKSDKPDIYVTINIQGTVLVSQIVMLQ